MAITRGETVRRGTKRSSRLRRVLANPLAIVVYRPREIVVPPEPIHEVLVEEVEEDVVVEQVEEVVQNEVEVEEVEEGVDENVDVVEEVNEEVADVEMEEIVPEVEIDENVPEVQMEQNVQDQEMMHNDPEEEMGPLMKSEKFFFDPMNFNLVCKIATICDLKKTIGLIEATLDE